MRFPQRFVRLLSIVVLGGLVLGVCLVALGPGGSKIAASARYTGTVAPDLRPLEGPTTLYDANGNVMDRLGDLDRTPVDLSDVPKTLRDAVIATEDHTFFTNPGVDVRSSLRAFLSNVDSGGIGQGGSTITQQLLKNRYFTNPKRDLDRKVREAILAARLTGEWSKRRILQEYLNTVYFGANAYGVQAASQRIIGAPLDKLDLGDAALLAGLIKDPIHFDPFNHPDAALRRRATVLRAMERQKKITHAEAAFANAKPLPTRDCAAAPNDPKCLLLEPHSLYAEEVKNRLLELEELGPNEKAAEQRVFAGGLRVYTAYQPALQAKAQAAVDSTVGRYAPFQGAMAVMDPRTGAVPALVSGTGRDYRGLDLATMGPVVPNSGRMVGSTFKAITLATAIANGYSPRDSVNGNAPCTIKFAEGTPGQPDYYPWWDVSKDGTDGHTFLNASGEGGGTDEIFGQTKHSVNCAFLRLLTSVGPEKVRKMASDLGLTRPVGKYLSIGIGDTAHSPLEMATVYSTFADEGIRHAPVFITRIEDSEGRVIYRAPGGKRVLTPQVARTVTDVLSHVTDPGATAPRAKLPDDRPIAGKTGTRDKSQDAWFAGYTPQLVAVVWMGDPASSLHEMKNVGGVSAVFGGTYPATMWQKF